MTSDLHITEEPAVVHGLIGQKDILWTARVRVDGHHGNHVSDEEFWIDFLADFDRQG